MEAQSRLGTLVGGKYRLDRVLGEGGMGAVYLALNVAVEKRYALKLLHAETGRSESSMRRFEREAKAAARIGHPNILDVFDLGQTDSGELYMVMELLSGESLADVIARGPLPVDFALWVARETLAALEAAHRAGIVHRDIKPPNIFLVRHPDGSQAVKILDFGIAKFGEGGDGHVTRPGTVLGSPHYMAPEQVRAESDVDARADVWSVGATLFEMLTGQPPHDGDTITAVITKIVTEPAPPLRSVREDLDPGLEAIVSRALSIDREQRYASAADMQYAIARLASKSEAPSAVAASVLPRSPEPRRRRSVVLVASLLAVLMVVAGGWSHRRSTAAARRAATDISAEPSTNAAPPPPPAPMNPVTEELEAKAEPQVPPLSAPAPVASASSHASPRPKRGPAHEAPHESALKPDEVTESAPEPVAEPGPILLPRRWGVVPTAPPCVQPQVRTQGGCCPLRFPRWNGARCVRPFPKRTD